MLRWYAPSAVRTYARDRYEYRRLKAKANELADRYGPDVVLIEGASPGIALAQELKARGGLVVEVSA